MNSSWGKASSLQSNDAIFWCDFPNLGSQNFQAVIATCLKTKRDPEACCIQPLCCRELIFTEVNILISPQIGFPNQIIIILKREMLHSKEFREKLQTLGLQIQEETEVTPELFEYCLVFTLTHRIAPLWNKVGEFMVQGKGFLEERSKLNAIRLGVTVSSKIFFSVNAFQMKLPPCQVEDFFVSPTTISKFRLSESDIIQDTSMDNNRCCVIPRTIPGTSPFGTYEELRKHWKLMYGYHLPSKYCKEYYNLRFYGGTIFTYPSYCIRCDEPMLFYRCDHESIQNSFLKDLIQRMPAICGIPITLSRTPLFQEVKLCKATSEKDSFLCQQPKPRISPPRAKPQMFNRATESVKENTLQNEPNTASLDDQPKLIPSFTKRKISFGNMNKKEIYCPKEKKTLKATAVARGKETTCRPEKTKTEKRPEQKKVLEGTAMPRHTTVPVERPRSSIALDLANQILQSASNMEFCDDDKEPREVHRGHDIQPMVCAKPVKNQSLQNSEPFKDSTSHDVKKPTKKPRCKPVITEITDMKELVRKNELKKANVATLKTWLKEKRRKFKANSKKEELIQLVKDYIACHAVEE